MRRAMQLAPWIKLFGGVRMIRKKIRANLIALSADPSWVSDSVVDGYTAGAARDLDGTRSEEHTSELQSRLHLVCRLLLEKKKTTRTHPSRRVTPQERRHVGCEDDCRHTARR